MRILRGVLGVVVGLIAISLIAEGIELLLVTALHGAAVGDPETYWSVRNRPMVLGLKLIYNTVAAAVGGYLAAWIAGHRQLAHGVALALVQLVLFVWGMTASEYAGTTPAWAWVTLCVTMTAAILLGARLRARGDGPDKLPPAGAAALLVALFAAPACLAETGAFNDGWPVLATHSSPGISVRVHTVYAVQQDTGARCRLRGYVNRVLSCQ